MNQKNNVLNVVVGYIAKSINDYKGIIFILAVLFLVLLLLTVDNSTRYYQSDALIEKTSNHLFQISSKNNILSVFNDSSGIETEIEILRSHSIMRDLVKKYNLDILSVRKGALYSNKVYAVTTGIAYFSAPSLFNGKKFKIVMHDNNFFLSFNNRLYPVSSDGMNVVKLSGGSKIEIRLDKNKKNILNYIFYKISMDMAVKRLQKVITIDNPTTYSKLIKISSITSSPVLSQSLINSVIEQADHFSRRRQSERLSKSIFLLKNKANELNKKIQKDVSSLIATLSKNNSLGSEPMHKYYIDRLSKIQNEIVDSKIELAQAQLKLTSSHPNVIKLKERYQHAKKIEFDLIKKIKSSPKKSYASNRIMESIESDKMVYHSIIKQLMQLEFLLKSNSSDISIIHLAYKPDAPLPKNTYIRILFLLLLSILMSIFCVLTLGFFFNIVRVFLLKKVKS